MIIKGVHTYDPLSGSSCRGDLEIEAGKIQQLAPGLGAGGGVDDRFRGRFLMPAFFDAHTHFVAGGEMLEQLDCSACSSNDQLLTALQERCQRTAAGEWVQGFGLDPDRLQPDLESVNRITAAHFLLLQTHDLHSALVNGPVLDRAGISAATADPPDGRIQRDSSGNPTGILSEAMVWKIRRMVPESTREQCCRSIANATRLAHSLGITAVSENAAPADAQLYRELDETGELKMQIDIWYRDGNFDPAIFENPQQKTAATASRAVKCFIDGAFGSRSAAMFDRYRDRDDRGVLMMEEERIQQFARQAVAEGWQLVMHAIGDRAVHVGLTALAAAIEQEGQGRGRHRLEHLQVVRPEDYQLMQKLQVVPSLQPVHLRHDQQWMSGYLTDAQLENCYRWDPYIDNDMITPFGTDWPVEVLDPLLNLHSAVTRMSADGRSSFKPEHSFTLARALRGLTRDAAWGAFLEQQRGSLQPGMDADLIVLSENPFELPAEELEKLEVLATWRLGELVYHQAGWE